MPADHSCQRKLTRVYWCVAIGSLAIASPSVQARMQTVSFESHTFRADNPVITLTGVLRFPTGKGPHPAVILLPNCGGSQRPEFASFWPEYLNKLGYVTLNVDVFTPRGGARCTKSFLPGLRDIGRDAFGALGFLAGVSGVDPSRIGVLGSSWGAFAINAFAGRNATVGDGLRFRAGVSLYPHHCRKVRPRRRMIPLLIVQGDREKDVTSCRQLSGRGRVTVHILPNTYHAFDQKDANRRRDGSFKTDLGGNKRLFNLQATREAQVLVKAFLAQHLSVAAASSSQPDQSQRGERRNPFKAVSKRDTDGDNRVSRAEWEKSDTVFARIDNNADGFLTAEEFFEHWQRLRLRRRRKEH